MRSRAAFAAAALVGALVGARAVEAQSPLTPEEKRVIGERLAPVANFERQLSIEAGGTLFVVHTLEVPAARFRKGDLDYEAFTTKLDAPSGVGVPKRVDQYKLTRRGNVVEISFRYAVTVEPRTTKGGKVAFTLQLLERTGLANEVATSPVVHQVDVRPAKPSAVAMAADFRGYRVYKALAQQGIKELAVAGLRGLTLSDNAPLPALDRVDAATTERAFDFDRWRRRMAIGRRHLEAAAASSDRGTASVAQQYLAKLDAPEDQLVGLPAVSLVPEGATGSAQVDAVEPTKPVAKSTVQDGVLQPLDPAAKKAEPDAFARPEPAKADAAPSKPVAPAITDVEVSEDEDLSFARKSKDELVPTYPRGLLLDDPNVAFGAWTRFSYATVADRRTAIVPAWFFGVQTMLTNDLGFELVIPTTYVAVTDIDEAVPVFTMGNPLLSGKWRFHLPAIAGRRPVLTPRVRWAVPINARNLIPRTSLGAEDFSFPAHFTDTYAFTLEKTDIGAGISAAYVAEIFHGTAQLGLDYYFPIKDTADQLTFTALSYGVSFGVRPWGDILGFYLEGRGTALVAGPRRSELFTYLGVRGKFFDYFEPAAWISLPIGSINRVSSLQFGLELRVSYDVEGVISTGTSRGRGTRLLEER